MWPHWLKSGEGTTRQGKIVFSKELAVNSHPTGTSTMWPCRPHIKRWSLTSLSIVTLVISRIWWRWCPWYLKLGEKRPCSLLLWQCYFLEASLGMFPRNQQLACEKPKPNRTATCRRFAPSMVPLQRHACELGGLQAIPAPSHWDQSQPFRYPQGPGRMAERQNYPCWVLPEFLILQNPRA